MNLRTTPPQAVHTILHRLGAKPDDLLLSISTDINLLGEYDPQWIMADSKSLWVIDPREGDGPVLSMPLAEVTEFRTVPVVGSGLLQAKTGDMWVDVCRYSNRLKYSFNRLSKRLSQLSRGERFDLTEEDAKDPCRCLRCGLMLEFPGETCPRCINRGAAMLRMLQLMKPYWRQAMFMLFLLFMGISLDVTNPLLTKFLIDDVLEGGGPSAGGLNSPRTIPFVNVQTQAVYLLLIAVGCVAAVQIFRQLINLLNGRVATRVGTAITFDIRGRMVGHLEKLGLAFYDKQQIGSLVQRVAADTEAVQGFMGQLTGGFVLQICLVVFSAAMMFSLQPKLAMWTLLPAPFVLSGTFLFYRFVFPKYRRFWDRSSRQAGMLNSMLSGIRVVKAFAQEDQELGRFQKSSAALRDARRVVDTTAATFYPLMGLVFQMGGWLVWYFGGSRVLDPDPATHLKLGTLMAFFGYMGMFYGPLGQLTHLTSWLTQFTTQVHRIFEVLDTPMHVPEVANPVRIPSMQGSIEFRNVVFGYSRQNPILKNVNFSIQPGQKIGVVGKSGSGKTTAVNLMLRFYDVDEGEIRIDGHELRKIATNDLRQQIGVVLQEPFLFRGTIWENLIYGKGETAVAPVLSAAKVGNCHDFIMRQPHAYDTWVGERGAGLSGGERQRLSIARALLCEPRILILDEATSSVDSESELAIQHALAEVIKGRTSIIIAHRLSTLRNCDCIYVFDEGKIVECGTHHDLMKLDGRYARLVRIQTSVSRQSAVDDLIQHELQKDQPARIEEMPATVFDPLTGLPPITSHHPRWLTPEVAKIHLGNRSALHVTVVNERIYNGVFAMRCMPVRYPSQYISLRWHDVENKVQEVGLIRDLAQWPQESQQLIRESLLRRYFIHTITGINDIHQFHNYLDFDVDTDLGPMEFIMRYSGHAAHDYGNGGKILLDIEDNRYLIPDVAALPPRDRTLFERYIYW